MEKEELDLLVKIIKEIRTVSEKGKTDKKIKYLTMFANLIFPPMIENIMNQIESRSKFLREIEHLGSMESLDNLRELAEKYANTEHLTEFFVRGCEDKDRACLVVVKSDKHRCPFCEGTENGK